MTSEPSGRGNPAWGRHLGHVSNWWARPMLAEPGEPFWKYSIARISNGTTIPPSQARRKLAPRRATPTMKPLFYPSAQALVECQEAPTMAASLTKSANRHVHD